LKLEKVKEETIESEDTESKYKEILLEPGTTLYGLSREYGVSVDEIKTINGLTSNSLSAGMKLKIPITTEEIKEEKTESISNETVKEYIVKPKDTFYSISRDLGISVSELKEKNNKTDNSLSIGEVLKY